jgi:hypothetical protein
MPVLAGTFAEAAGMVVVAVVEVVDGTVVVAVAEVDGVVTVVEVVVAALPEAW